MMNSRALAGLALTLLLAGACAGDTPDPVSPGAPLHNGGLYGSGGKSDGSGTTAGSGTSGTGTAAYDGALYGGVGRAAMP